MKQKAYLLIALLCSFVQGALAWDGSGTSTDPYLIKNSADWKQLADDVSGGNSFSDMFFEMSADIDAQGISVGSESKPFSGTFSGGMYTLTYNAGTISRYTEGLHAPFVLLKGAAIKDLKVVGAIYSKSKYSAGLACFVDGAKTTTVSGCHVSTQINGSYDVNADANFGGFVAYVKSTSSNPLTFTNCSFQGLLGDFSAGSACFVGLTRVPITIEHCMVDPVVVYQGIANTATFVRAADGVNCTLKECYYTQAYGAEQGQGVFKSVKVPDGCKAEIISKPALRFNGVDYYGAGTKVSLTVPEGTQFDHWTTEGKPVGCFISDPWTASGIHTIYDIRTQPKLSIATSLPASPQSNRQRYGINYRYLSRNDYKLFMSDSLFQARGYHFDKDGLCYFYDGKGTMTYLTVVWNCDANAETFQNFFRDGWFQDKDYEGCIIDNDLVSDAWEHTHLFAIAPRAFLNVSNLKRIVFKSDIDPTLRGNATVGLDVAIQEQAFKGSGLEELVMMYRNEKSEQWEVLGPTSGLTVAADAFEGTSAHIAVDPSVYQSYLADKNWSAHRSRFSIYAAKVEDMKVNGAVYSYMRNTSGEPLKNINSDHTTLMETLRYWNADYKEFTASSLLSTSNENIWYTNVVGVDAGSLDDGTMRIYNDPGSYYNYKTIAIESLGQSKDVQKIEFWQTNGRSENSLSEPKMVIRNGAFKGCDNLKEIRLFYYVQDGDDHWETLGPKDVIPGDDIFGINTLSDSEMESAIETKLKTRIVVSTNRYQEFLDDPNWQRYDDLLVPQDGPSPQVKGDFTKAGVTYGYMTNPGGIMQTSQTVSQDVSWWTVPRIMVEVALTAASLLDNSAATEFKDKLDEFVDYVGKIEDNITSDKSALRALNTKYKTVWENHLDVPLERRVYAQQFAGKNLVKDLGYSVEDKSYKALVDLGVVEKGNMIESAELKNFMIKAGEKEARAVCRNLEKAHATMSVTIKSQVEHNQGLLNYAIKEYLNFPVSSNSSVGIRQAGEEILKNMPNAFKSIFTGKGVPGHSSALFSAITANGIYASHFYGSGNYDAEGMRQGMRQNILSNIHQVGLVGGGYIITTPAKNLAYHTYIKDVPNQETVTLYTGTDEGGLYANTTTAAIAKNAFHGKSNVRVVQFQENEVTTNEAVPMVLVIPDSVFAGTSIHTLDLRLQTKENGTQAMGPESFILAGSNTFAGVDTLTFHIIIDPSRKDEFLLSESWAPYQRYFTYESAAPKSRWSEYGGYYGLAYENGSVQRVHKVSGHKVEHTLVTEPDDLYLASHGGALKLCNDIGIWNNYQLDAVISKAFYGNKNLRTVNFTDLPDIATGNCYTGLNVTLQDSCFAHSRLKYIEMLYLVTDGTNHIDLITPQQVKIGQGVLDGTYAQIKMMPKQVAWFEADSAWAAYKDRFLPCIIRPSDKGFKAALKGAVYYDQAHSNGEAATWDDYIDLSRVSDQGFDWLNGKFREQRDDLYSGADFKYFEALDLNYVGKEWFSGCHAMSNILLPKTIKSIRESAFSNCTSLQEIELPAGVTSIEAEAFAGCTRLNTIVVRNTEPCSLGGGVFPKHDGLKIYVPAESLSKYLSTSSMWWEYRDYIVGDADYHINKVVKLDVAGTLADKLGLSVDWSYTGLIAGDEPSLLSGPYAKYDSLTVSGPLNDLDIWVIRYLGGCNSYESAGNPTDGCLRYLNLYDADIVKDDNCKAHYWRTASTQWQCIDASNQLPRDIFRDCTAFETVVLPKSLTSIETAIFEGCTALKRVAITGAVKEYDGWRYSNHLFDNPVQELVLLTDQYATTSAKNPWGADLQNVYTYQSLIGDYMGDVSLIAHAMMVSAPFKDDAVMKQLANKGEFFPSEYLPRKSVEGIFTNSSVKDFDDFINFMNVQQLESTFAGAAALKRITLPASVESIAAEAFAGCSKLDTIRVISTKPASLAENAFADLPADFRILVPSRYAKLYRTEWAQYADHINADDSYMATSDILTVNVDEPNTLGKALGLNVTTHEAAGSSDKYLVGVNGDYSHIHKLKVVGPIGAVDIDLMNYLAGYCSWIRSRNYAGHLEYIDLYDAQIKETDECNAVHGEYKRWDGTSIPMGYYVKDNVLPQHSFLRAYSLKTLVLPKTCKEVRRRALQECEALETLVIGDDMEDFNWSALDDDAMLTRLYILAKKKPAISSDFPIWRWLCNNYNPTFDAFYVRPSQYTNYLLDEAYTGSSWQRTNNISTGVFNDDASFCLFASHGTAARDEMAAVTSVKGWFDNFKDVRDLSALRYTSIDTLDKATLAPLKDLEQIAMPVSLCKMEEGLFENTKHLGSVDFLMCDSTGIIADLREGGFAKYGINTQQTLAYVPATYGETSETNVVVNNNDHMRAYEYSLIDTLDYVVPYAFETILIKNSRKLYTSPQPYTMCLPYAISLPQSVTAYKLSGRDANTLLFEEETSVTLEAMHPYLLVVNGNDPEGKVEYVTLDSYRYEAPQFIPASTDIRIQQDDALGYSIRGTLKAMSNAEAADLGAYILQSDGEWHPVSTSNQKASILPYRAYLLPSARNAMSRIGMQLGDNATGIDSYTTIDTDGTERTYDLQGREINARNAKGVVIINGRKVIKK